jgi:hypothetical protein
MNEQVIIEYPAAGETYCHNSEYGVYRYSDWPPGTALAGTPRRSMLDIYPSLKEARKDYPGAEWNGEGWSGRDMIPPVPLQAPPGNWDPYDTPWNEDD